MSNQERLETLRQPDGAQQTVTKSRKAKVSLTLGLFSFFVSILAGIPAIINGLLSLREIRRSGGRLQGKQLAVSGIMLGLLGSLASGSVILYGVSRVQLAIRRTEMG